MGQYFQIYVAFPLLVSSGRFALIVPSVELGTQVASQNGSLPISEINISVERKYSTITKDDRRYVRFLFGKGNDIFVSGAAIYGFFRSIFSSGAGVKPSEYSMADIMETIDTAYIGAIQSLNGVYEIMRKEQKLPYKNVEAKVQSGISDMNSNSSVELCARAVQLYDQVAVLLSGMLRNSTVGVDIVRFVRTFRSVSKCRRARNIIDEVTLY